MPALCQKRTLSRLFDHLVGALQDCFGKVMPNASCRISSWPHHAIPPAQPNSRRSHFLYLSFRSSQHAWSFLTEPRRRQWTSYWHSSTSSTRPSLSSVAQALNFSSSFRNRPQKPYTHHEFFHRNLPMLKPMTNRLMGKAGNSMSGLGQKQTSQGIN